MADDWKESKLFFDRAMAGYRGVEIPFARFSRNQCASNPWTYFDCRAKGDGTAFFVFLQENDCKPSQYNHYNVVLVRGKDMYLFEPAKRDSRALIQLLEIHFPDHHIKLIDFHPQQSKDDFWCMAYICMFAQAFIKDKTGKKSMKEIGKEAMKEEEPNQWLARMYTETGGDLPNMPRGHPHDHDEHSLGHTLDPLHVFPHAHK